MSEPYGPKLGLIITRLLEEARKLNNDPSQSPAIQCSLLLYGQLQPMAGALSRTSEGTLKLMMPATVDNRPTLIEAFFDIGSVVAIMVEREIAAAPAKSSIIMGS
jgi:hypothetical protein